MQSRRFPLHPIMLQLCLSGLLGAGAMTPVHAQWAVQPEGMDIKALHRFETFLNNGQAAALNPMAPPVLASATSNSIVLQGTTIGGRPAKDPNAFGMDIGGVSYQLRVAPDGSTQQYEQWEMPSGTGWVNTALVDLGNGKYVGSSMHYQMSPFGVIPQLAALADGKVTLLSPANNDYTGPLGGRNAATADPDGNIYYGHDTPHLLIRRDTSGKHEVMVDFDQFFDSAKSLYLKGGSPVLLFWSQQDDYLYIGSTIPAYPSTHYPGVADPNSTMTSSLARIPGAVLRNGKPTADDIEVLQYITKGNCVASSSIERFETIVEDGTWLYGNCSNGLWRFNRAAPEQGVGFIQFQPDLSAVHSASSPNLAGGPAGFSAGPIVRALDGNIYATSSQDASITTAQRNGNIVAAGKGALLRIVTGTQPDRSDDRIETLRYFNDSILGQTPLGVYAGPVVNGKQWLLGASPEGGSLPDCQQNCTRGLVYALEVPLPPVTFKTPLASDKTSYAVGERPILTWESSGADRCTASGGWSGTQQTTDRFQLPALTQAGTVQYVLTCEGSAGSVSSETSITVTRNEVTPVTPPTQEVDVGGGGGSSAPMALTGLMLLALARRRHTRA